MLPNLISFGIVFSGVASVAIAAPSFPNSLQGQWTDNIANCGREDTAGMRIGAQSIEFYEAQGTPKSVHILGNGTIAAELTYRGEGKTWRESNRFVISGDKSSVSVTALGRTFMLTRCA